MIKGEENAKEKPSHEVDPVHLGSVLNESLDVSDTDLSNLISKILRLSRTKSNIIVNKIRHEKERDPKRFAKKIY